MRVIKLLSCLLVAAALWACGGGGGSPGSNPNQADLGTTAPDGLVLPAGTAQTFQIRGGVPPYSAATPNAAIVGAAVSGSSLVLTGLNASTSAVSVVVQDSKGASVTVGVTISGPGGATPVALFSTADAGVTLRVGTSADYLVGGGTTPYLAPASSNSSVAIATLTGGNLKIIAVSSGTASISVRDSVGGTVSIPVTVQNPALAVNPAAGTGSVGDLLTFNITGGVPFTLASGVQTYALINTNPSLATASISGSTVTVRLVAAGTAALTLSDSEGKAIALAVTITNAVPNFRIAPSALTISEDYATAIPLVITGGSGTYTAFSSNSVVAPVTITGSTISVGGGSAGGKRCVAATTTVTITAVDSNGFSATSNLTINEIANTVGNCP